jgi:hypothetical protein
MIQTIQHTLWVFDTGLRDFRSKTIPDALSMLNGRFLSNCVGNVGTSFRIDSAAATTATGSTISPGRFDAVVFLVRDVDQSVGARIGGDLTQARNNRMILGNTFLGHPAGRLSEVYWDRCFNNNEAATAIFHEAAHAKSGLGGAMHTARVGAPHGGPGLRVLAEYGGGQVYPSEDDLDFYSDAITKPIVVRTQVP